MGGFSPYPISYRSIVPRKGEAANLFVPVCLSASHIAYGSIRMEPVFMILGQTSATAAVMAIDAGTDVQSVDYPALRKRLLEAGQILESPPNAARVAALEPAKLEGIVMDDEQAAKSGKWTESRASAPYMGAGYLHDGNAHDGKASASFRVAIPSPGAYRVRVLYPVNANRATNATVKIEAEAAPVTAHINQRQEPAWLGPYRASKSLVVTVSNPDTDGYVVVDGVQVVAVPQ